MMIEPQSSPDRLSMLRLDQLEPSPSNPRKHLGDLTDLTESIRQAGVLQPIVVRPRDVLTGDAVLWQIVFGHRRHAAAAAAGVESIPAIIRDLDDDQVLEAQIIENSQRDDVHPLDEADGFGRLVERGHDAASIAAKIGRPPAYVAQRLKLLTLTKAGREALDDERMTLAVALLVARIPDAKLQDEALEEVAGNDWDAPKKAAEAAEIIEERFMLRLDEAPFDVTDPKLVAKAGACSVCPKRTGNQAELFADVKSPDLCTDPKCYRVKLDALWKIRKKTAADQGVELLEGKDAEKALSYSGGFKKLDEETWSGNKRTTVRKQLGKTLPPITLAQDPRTGAHVELVRETDYQKATKAKGVEVEVERNYDAGAAQRKQDAQQKRRRTAVELAVAELVEKAEAAPPHVLLDVLARALVRGSQHEHRSMTCKRRKLFDKTKAGAAGTDVEEKLSKLAEGLPQAERWGLSIELAVRRSAPSNWNETGGKVWAYALEMFGVDYKAIAKRVLDEQRAKAKAKGKKPATPASAKKPKRTPGVCRECGCTDDAACPGGCAWVEPDLCSSCAPPEQVVGTNGNKSAKPSARNGTTKAARARKRGQKSAAAELQ